MTGLSLQGASAEAERHAAVDLPDRAGRAPRCESSEKLSTSRLSVPRGQGPTTTNSEAEQANIQQLAPRDSITRYQTPTALLTMMTTITSTWPREFLADRLESRWTA